MNIIIGNKYLSVLNGLDIEVTKKLEGEFVVDDIINTFKNFFFNKMFLDITAIKDYKDVYNLQRLSININMDKVILLLDKDDPISNSNMFLSKLVGFGIYNFTADSGNLMYLYSNPNSYKDVMQYEIKENTDDNVSLEHKLIFGIKNITSNAGATTLCYLLKKMLSKNYNVLLMEIDKRDFAFLKDDTAISIKDGELGNVVNSDKHKDINVFIVDLNESDKYSYCTDVLFLIEPSTIKLNKLVMTNPNCFEELQGKKVILNKLKLAPIDVANFEVESKLKVFYNIGAINDKENFSEELEPLLKKLGFNVKEKRSIFGLFNNK